MILQTLTQNINQFDKIITAFNYEYWIFSKGIISSFTSKIGETHRLSLLCNPTYAVSHSAKVEPKQLVINERLSVMCVAVVDNNKVHLLKYNFEVLLPYLSIFSICYFILLLHCILEANSVLFSPLHLFDSFSY